MSALDSAEPEQMIVAMKRRRLLTLVFVLAGIVVGLGCLFGAAGAMYAKNPVRDLQTEKAALEPAAQP